MDWITRNKSHLITAFACDDRVQLYDDSAVSHCPACVVREGCWIVLHCHRWPCGSDCKSLSPTVARG